MAPSTHLRAEQLLSTSQLSEITIGGKESIILELSHVLNLYQGPTGTTWLPNLRSITIDLNRRRRYDAETVGEQLYTCLLERTTKYTNQIVLRGPNSILSSSGVKRLAPLLLELVSLE